MAPGGQDQTLIEKHWAGVPFAAQQLTNLTSIHEDVGSILGLTQWVQDPVFAVSCGVGPRCSLDLAFLWHKPAAAAPIQPLAWELPYAVVQP